MNRIVWIITIFILVLLGGLAGWNLRERTRPGAHVDAHSGNGSEEHAEEGHGHDSGPISIPPEAAESNGVTLSPAGPGIIEYQFELPGEIVLNEDHVVHVVPRFAGVVEAVHKNVGDPVRAGELLAVVQSNTSLSSYEIRSQVAGTVIEKHVALGEFVRDDADIFVIADLSTVWVNISVYSRFLPRVRPGQPVRLTAHGVEDDLTTQIEYVRPILGESTRAAVARAVLGQRAAAWQPGLFVTAHVTVSESSYPIVVPDGAIQTVEGHPVVFVRRPDGFHPRRVELGVSDGRNWEVKSGLEKSELYVSDNSFILKAELGKSEAGHEH